ncbi:MAG: asparagine synthetase B, partial [Bacteroidales bacterium]|nr:asparagine synthetase B [Bacteroidales bacterium]
MCGIAGYYDRCGISRKALLRMSSSLAHRGPDDEGFMLFTRNGMSCPLSGPATSAGVKDVDHIERACLEFPAIVGWAHRRLSILDLSPAGHQPMYISGQAALMMNGEIYNYRELKEELIRLGHVFHSQSDTEVALKAYIEWGTECFSRFRGMWALAIFDEVRKEMILCRDRFAIKPLYFHSHEGHLSFASEIKALLEVPKMRAAIDERSLYQYLAFPSLSDPCATLFSGIRELEPGHFLRLDMMDGALNLTAYYHLESAIEAVNLPDTEEAMLKAYREQLQD